MFLARNFRHFWKHLAQNDSKLTKLLNFRSDDFRNPKILGKMPFSYAFNNI